MSPVCGGGEQWQVSASHREEILNRRRRREEGKKGPLFRVSESERTTIFYQILNSNSNIEYYPTYTPEFHNRVVSKKKTKFIYKSFFSSFCLHRFSGAVLSLFVRLSLSNILHLTIEAQSKLKYFS